MKSYSYADALIRVVFEIRISLVSVLKTGNFLMKIATLHDFTLEIIFQNKIGGSDNYKNLPKISFTESHVRRYHPIIIILILIKYITFAFYYFFFVCREKGLKSRKFPSGRTVFLPAKDRISLFYFFLFA